MGRTYFDMPFYNSLTKREQDKLRSDNPRNRKEGDYRYRVRLEELARVLVHKKGSIKLPQTQEEGGGDIPR